jgi:hypothetical protein
MLKNVYLIVWELFPTCFIKYDLSTGLKFLWRFYGHETFNYTLSHMLLKRKKL